MKQDNTLLSWRFDPQQTALEQIEKRQVELSEWVREFQGGDKSRATASIKRIADVPFSESELQHINQKNCEHMIGSVSLPLAVVGPVSVRLTKNSHASENCTCFVPLATTEGALVASVNRGLKALSVSASLDVIAKHVGMSRAPMFVCNSGLAAQAVAEWLEFKKHIFVEVLESTSTHLKFVSWKTFIQGRRIWIRVVADTDQAMGMNMLTIGLQKTWDEFERRFGEELRVWGVELEALSGNLCVDKKASGINRILGRGWWFQAEAVLQPESVQNVLKTTPDALERVHIHKNLVGSHLAEASNQNMQAANVVAAFFAATGQDLAHVVEAAQINTSLEILSGGGVYVSVTAPNINLATVGGGTWLPQQKEAQQLIVPDRRSSEQPRVEHLGAALMSAVLAAEISGLAALSAGHLAKAHQRLGRITDDKGKS